MNTPSFDEVPASVDRKKYEIVLSVTRLVGLLAILMTIFTAIYSFVLDSKLTNLELRLANQFITKGDAMSKAEYEYRHSEVVKENAKQQSEIEALNNRIQVLERGDLLLEQKVQDVQKKR